MSGSRSQAAADARAAAALAHKETLVDVAVVGGGASGLAAALWIARFGRSVLVLDSGE